MVHWKRDLDLYTIGRPLERNAGFWLDYMKGLKGDHGDRQLRRLPPPLPSYVPTPHVPRAVSLGPQDPFSDPFFADRPLPAPLDLPLSPAYDDLRDIIERARQRYRQRRADMGRRESNLAKNNGFFEL